MSKIIRVTREFSFEMAHVLRNYDGPCRNIHGHSYKLFVTLSGTPINDNKNPKNGMVIDFSIVKQIVNEYIINKFDHSVVLSNDFESQQTTLLKSMFENTIIVDYQPTCENLVSNFADILANKFPKGTHLYSLKLYETEKSYAEWFSSDNQ